MLRFLADENLNNNILRGLSLRDSTIDVLRVIDAGLGGAGDQELLEFAAGERRIIVSHDVETLAGYAYERVARALKMPGVIEVPEWLPVRPAIEDLLLLAGASLDGEFENRVIYFPLR